MEECTLGDSDHTWGMIAWMEAWQEHIEDSSQSQGGTYGRQRLLHLVGGLDGGLAGTGWRWAWRWQRRNSWGVAGLGWEHGQQPGGNALEEGSQ